MEAVFCLPDVGIGDAGDGVAGADPAYAERAWVCPGFEKGVLEPGTELLSCPLAIEGLVVPE